MDRMIAYVNEVEKNDTFRSMTHGSGAFFVRAAIYGLLRHLYDDKNELDNEVLHLPPFPPYKAKFSKDAKKDIKSETEQEEERGKTYASMTPAQRADIAKQHEAIYRAVKAEKLTAKKNTVGGGEEVEALDVEALDVEEDPEYVSDSSEEDFQPNVPVKQSASKHTWVRGKTPVIALSRVDQVPKPRKAAKKSRDLTNWLLGEEDRDTTEEDPNTSIDSQSKTQDSDLETFLTDPKGIGKQYKTDDGTPQTGGESGEQPQNVPDNVPHVMDPTKTGKDEILMMDLDDQPEPNAENASKDAVPSTSGDDVSVPGNGDDPKSLSGQPVKEKNVTDTGECIGQQYKSLLTTEAEEDTGTSATGEDDLFVSPDLTTSQLENIPGLQPAPEEDVEKPTFNAVPDYLLSQSFDRKYGTHRDEETAKDSQSAVSHGKVGKACSASGSDMATSTGTTETDDSDAQAQKAIRMMESLLTGGDYDMDQEEENRLLGPPVDDEESIGKKYFPDVSDISEADSEVDVTTVTDTKVMEATKETTKEATKEATKDPTNEATNEATKEATNEATNEATSVCPEGSGQEEPDSFVPETQEEHMPTPKDTSPEDDPGTSEESGAASKIVSNIDLEYKTYIMPRWKFDQIQVDLNLWKQARPTGLEGKRIMRRVNSMYRSMGDLLIDVWDPKEEVEYMAYTEGDSNYVVYVSKALVPLTDNILYPQKYVLPPVRISREKCYNHLMQVNTPEARHSARKILYQCVGDHYDRSIDFRYKPLQPYLQEATDPPRPILPSVRNVTPAQMQALEQVR